MMLHVSFLVGSIKLGLVLIANLTISVLNAVVGPFTFNVTMDLVRFVSAILYYFSTCSLCCITAVANSHKWRFTVFG